MALVIPRQRLYDCSAMFGDDVEKMKLDLDDDSETVILLAKQAIDMVLPELQTMVDAAVGVESDVALQSHDDEVRAFAMASFVGNLASMRLSDVHKNEVVEGLGTVTTVKPDILLVFRQKIQHPDPVDLGYSDEILVPMHEMGHMRLTA